MHLNKTNEATGFLMSKIYLKRLEVLERRIGKILQPMKIAYSRQDVKRLRREGVDYSDILFIEFVEPKENETAEA